MIEIKKGQVWIHKFGLRNASKEKIEIVEELNSNCYNTKSLYTGNFETHTENSLKENYMLDKDNGTKT
jgi:hypothetical protein